MLRMKLFNPCKENYMTTIGPWRRKGGALQTSMRFAIFIKDIEIRINAVALNKPGTLVHCKLATPAFRQEG